MDRRRPDLTLYLNPPDNSFETTQHTPFVVYVASCCGEEVCVAAAWEQIKASSVGKVEAG